MIKKVFLFVLAISILAAVPPAQAQQPKAHRVGVITSGGPWYEVLDGLRVGLRKLGIEEGKQFVLAIRDTKGETKVAEEAARNLEQEKVDLIYTTQSSVTITARRATIDIPIVFCAGADPVDLGLVGELRKAGGKTHRRILPGHRPHRKAPRTPEGDCPEAPPRSDVL